MTLKLISQTRRTHRPRVAGFSLIELLVVVSIIALLATGSVSVYGKVINSIKSTKAGTSGAQLANAVKSFYTEYETWPVEISGGDDTQIDSNDPELMKALMGKNPDRNTKSLNYLDGMKQAKKGPERMEDGLDYDANPDAPALLDPWGTPFRLLLDSNFDDEISNPDSGNGGRPIRGNKAVFYSAGKDMNFDTWSDNVKSW